MTKQDGTQSKQHIRKESLTSFLSIWKQMILTSTWVLFQLFLLMHKQFQHHQVYGRPSPVEFAENIIIMRIIIQAKLDIIHDLFQDALAFMNINKVK
jgi:hypothetical protein